MEHENCHHWLGSLSEYMDGTLDVELCAAIEHHLAGCDNCQIVIDSLRKTVSLYQLTSEAATVPEEVRRRLYKRLDLDEFLSAANCQPV